MLGVLVATPVIELLQERHSAGVVRGVGRTAAYVDVDGFVVALTGRGVALMPNGIGLAERPTAADWPRVGVPVQLGPGGLAAGPGSVTWATDGPVAWDPAVRVPAATAPCAIRARGAAILAARGIEPATHPGALATAFEAVGVGGAGEPAGRNGIALLLHSVATRAPEPAARAGELLIGRGRGLTPEGDDLVAATAAVVAALAEPAGWTRGERDAWLASVLPPRLRRLTTPLSATLLELAVTGQAVEPLQGLFDFSPAGERRWLGALRRLARSGHSTGPAYLAAAGATALLCAG
ncbi:MAG: oxamate carbamoyltransferase subunit AllH family protein [Conexibacter sp.]